MKVAPQQSLSRPHSIIETGYPPARRLFRIEKVDELGHHGINIGGFYLSSNCNTFLLVMALIFITGGIILTAIAYR